MYSSLFTYISQYTQTTLTQEEQDLIQRAFQPKKLRKKQYLLQEGDICRYLGFVVRGAMRQYSIDDKGTEHMVQFAIENWWVGDRESFLMLTPSVYNIDAWEDTEVLLIEKADLLQLYEQVPAMTQMARQMDDRHSMASQRRINAAISFSAEKRYAEFVDCYPEFLQRFPQHLIASYLGITKETLSRIRKQQAL
ncbi:Crp/Fnr family transcriptional regulator [Rufibacter latericius]|uniref:Crp/Fnr family transcriptional regulator n=1 Tax=Rufibacter latericius TaxID=2487040 RepID=A0A3M9MT88_9BACT|nr:Crp/Fnr family transcriptional regulator [Rufibacter latericius]RNI28709.1 Crp/Fnr family transcriptional regulator [Rufibacter latericius]